ncbi:MAG: 23S rRNA (adenine(2503)-C(2))-methyltransferase RlmN [Chitinophagaceae bacterium]
MNNLRHLSLTDVEDLMRTMGEPRFRAAQIWEWMWRKSVDSIEGMSNLSKALRQRLSEEYTIPKVTIHHSQFSSDGTIKNRLQLHDGHFVESVLIPTEKRVTVCVSSQVGCSLSCKFCATGFLKRARNVDFDEIVDEVTLAQAQALEHYGRPLTNIVYMGMGEPLLNYKHVLASVERITAPDGLGMSPRRITISTSGVSKMIYQLGEDEVKFKLALSLHSANDEKRSKIMPINETNDLQSLITSLNHFYKKTGNEITLEYILFDKLNDGLEDADELVKFYRQVPADLVNIIEYNPIDGADFQKPEDSTVAAFMKYLESKRVNARLRRSRGKDIDAACGQLANVDGVKG